MWWIIDIVVILFMFLCVFYGYKKGLVKLGLRLFSLLIAILITFILYRPIGNFIINNTQIDEKIENIILGRSEEKTEEQDKEISQYALEEAKKAIMPEMANSLAINIVYIGTTIILFFLLKLTLLIITSFTSAVTSLPIIQQCNKAGGILYGLIVGIIIIYGILLAISFYSKINPENKINEVIEKTIITNMMYNVNIFSIFFNN